MGLGFSTRYPLFWMDPSYDFFLKINLLLRIFIEILKYYNVKHIMKKYTHFQVINNTNHAKGNVENVLLLLVIV